MTQTKRTMSRLLSAAGLMVFCSSILATAALAQFTEGEHYEPITGPGAGSGTEDGVVEVVEVFGYPCPHCRTFQPYVSEWEESLPEDVSFRRVPVSFSPSWEPFARAYYTANALDILDKSHSAVFVALHDEQERLRTFSDLAEFHAQFGVDADTFESTSESFPVESGMRRGQAEIGKWGIRSTPSLVINGKWRVSPRRGGTFEEMLEVADYLIERERTESGDAEAVADS